MFLYHMSGTNSIFGNSMENYEVVVETYGWDTDGRGTNNIFSIFNWFLQCLYRMDNMNLHTTQI